MRTDEKGYALVKDHTCATCGKPFRAKRVRDRTFCTRRCAGLSSTIGRGARWIVQGGYVMAPVSADHPVGRVYGRREREHVLVAEKALGRRIKRGEVVHHINGIKSDNRPQNLLICTISYHRWLHERMSFLYQQEHFMNGEA